MKLRYLLPAIFWFGIIALVISIPGSNIPKSSLLNIPYFDKLVHACMFAVFSLLLVYGFFKQPKSSFFARQAYILAFILCTIYGGATELMQYFFFASRSGEVVDFIANISGSVVGMIAFHYLSRHKKVASFFSL